MAVLGGLPFGATGVAVAVVMTSLLLAVPSISYAGRPIGVGAALVIRAVGQQLIGAISTAAGRLVAANNRSHPLFQLRPYLFVDRLLYLHLPYYSCGPVSAYRAD